jgi:hypothetical protein
MPGLGLAERSRASNGTQKDEEVVIRAEMGDARQRKVEYRRLEQSRHWIGRKKRGRRFG